MKLYQKANAKINLTLNVVGKRSDGYHDLKMIMAPINLYDDIIIEESTCDEVVCDVAELSGENNIVFKTIQLLKDIFDINSNVKISIIKKIPVGGGLGGGSADCAAALRGLNIYWNLQLNLDELALIGVKLGADVPFCIYNKSAVVTGVGEKIKFIEGINSYILLVIPGETISTKEVFLNTSIIEFKNISLDHHMKRIRENDIEKLKMILFNDLQEVTLKISSRCNSVYQRLLKVDTNFIMTGSGSVFYSIYPEKGELERVNRILKSEGFETIVSTINKNS